MNDVEILESVCGGVKIKDMTAITFYGWLASKLNGIASSMSAPAVELRTAVANPPMIRKLSDDSKISYVGKLLALGITL